jgi:hypothetical protein
MIIDKRLSVWRAAKGFNDAAHQIVRRTGPVAHLFIEREECLAAAVRQPDEVIQARRI